MMAAQLICAASVFFQCLRPRNYISHPCALNINRLNLVCWHNWIWGPPAAEFTRLSAHKSTLIGCYGRITNITRPNLLLMDR